MRHLRSLAHPAVRGSCAWLRNRYGMQGDMSLQDIRDISVDLDTPALLRFLVTEKFPGETVVTASLRARSIVVLKMVSDIDPAIPVIFCHRRPVFKESIDYRSRIIDLLGLQNVSTNEGREVDVCSGDQDHCERMWVENQTLPGRTNQLLHLNDSLKPYRCWISAVYHVPRPAGVRNRVDVEGLLIRIDPLIRWTQEEISAFMKDNNLPYHQRAARDYVSQESHAGEASESYHF